MSEGLRTGILRHPQNQALAEFLIENPEDIELKEWLKDLIDEQNALAIVDPDPFRPTAPIKHDDISGAILIGKTSNETPYGINPDSLCRHMLLVGASGSGKTVIMTLLAAQLVGRIR